MTISRRRDLVGARCGFIWARLLFIFEHFIPIQGLFMFISGHCEFGGERFVPI